MERMITLSIIFLFSLNLISAGYGFCNPDLPNSNCNKPATITTISFNNNTASTNHSLDSDKWGGHTWHNMSLPFFNWLPNFYNMTKPAMDYADGTFLKLDKSNFYDDGWIVYDSTNKNFTFNTTKLEDYVVLTQCNPNGVLDDPISYTLRVTPNKIPTPKLTNDVVSIKDVNGVKGQSVDKTLALLLRASQQLDLKDKDLQSQINSIDSRVFTIEKDNTELKKELCDLGVKGSWC